MKLFKNQKGFSDVITVAILAGVIGSIFIGGAFVWQEIDKQNTLNNFYSKFSKVVKIEKEEVEEKNIFPEILAVAYYKESSTSELIIKKINVSTGEVIENNILDTSNARLSVSKFGASGASTAVQFSSDGKTLYFLSGNYGGISGLEAGKIGGSILYSAKVDNTYSYEKILDYSYIVGQDNDHQYITHWLLSSDNSKIVYVVQDIEDNDRDTLEYIVYSYNLSTKKINKLTSFSNNQQIISFSYNNQSVTVAEAHNVIREISLKDGSIISTIDVQEKSGYSDRLKLDADRISGDQSKLVFVASKANKWSVNLLDLKTGDIKSGNFGYIRNINNFWGPNSKLFLSIHKEGIKIFSEDFESIDTIDNASYVYLWAPSNKIIYTTNGEGIKYYDYSLKLEGSVISDLQQVSYVKGINWVWE